MKKIIYYWLPVLVWALIIFTFSSITTIKTTEIYWQDFALKKFAHITEYAVLTFLLYRAFLNSGFNKEESGFYSVLISILYAFSDEYHQSFTPGRESTLRDVIFDALGSVLAIYVIWKLVPKLPGKLKLFVNRLQII